LLVLGLASLQNRTGVISIARYDRNFFVDSPEEYLPVDTNYIAWRTSKAMVHEITHMFGVLHCVYFSCIMNGSNHAEENTVKPVELCPVCLRKLQKTIGFNIVERYQELNKVCENFGGSFVEAGKWYLGIYDLVMKKYGANYKKYLEEEKSQKVKQEQVEVSKLFTMKPKAPVKGIMQKVSIVGAKIKMDDQIDLYKGL